MEGSPAKRRDTALRQLTIITNVIIVGALATTGIIAGILSNSRPGKLVSADQNDTSSHVPTSSPSVVAHPKPSAKISNTPKTTQQTASSSVSPTAHTSSARKTTRSRSQAARTSAKPAPPVSVPKAAPTARKSTYTPPPTVVATTSSGS